MEGGEGHFSKSRKKMTVSTPVKGLYGESSNSEMSLRYERCEASGLFSLPKVASFPYSGWLGIQKRARAGSRYVW